MVDSLLGTVGLGLSLGDLFARILEAKTTPKEGGMKSLARVRRARSGFGWQFGVAMVNQHWPHPTTCRVLSKHLGLLVAVPMVLEEHPTVCE